MGMEQKSPTTVFQDNQATISFSNEGGFSQRSKHIDTRDKFVHQHIMDNTITLEYLKTDEHIADMLTKSLPHVSYSKFANTMVLDYSY